MDTLCIDEIQEILTTSKIRNVKYDYNLCIGDFNFKEIDCENNSTNVGPNNMATKFIEMVRDTFISACYIKMKQDSRGNNQPIPLDLIFTNEEGMIHVDAIEHARK